MLIFKKDIYRKRAVPSQYELEYQALVPAEQGQFYKDLAELVIKETINTANTSLSQILSLITALFGGVVAFWNNVPIKDPCRFILLWDLLINIMMSLVATTPSIGRFDR